MASKKHAELIRAWLDGAEIERQYNSPFSEQQKWVVDRDPSWHHEHNYRIKPTEPERAYPETQMTQDEFSKACAPYEKLYWPTAFANAALRHAIDAGQVFTRKEFHQRDSAVALAAFEYINEWLTKDWRKVLGPNVTISTEPHHIAAVVARVKP